MAKPEQYLPQPQPDLKLLIPSACGHGVIKTWEEAYIYSKATGEAYCDCVCLCQANEVEYTTRKAIIEDWEVVEHG